MELKDILISHNIEESCINIIKSDNDEIADDSILVNSQKKFNNILQNEEFYKNDIKKLENINYIYNNDKNKYIYYIINMWKKTDKYINLLKLFHLESQNNILYPSYNLKYKLKYNINNAEETLYYLDLPIEPFIFNSKYHINEFLFVKNENEYKPEKYLFLEININNINLIDDNLMITYYDAIERITVIDSDSYYCENIPKNEYLKYFTFCYIDASKIQMNCICCISTSNKFNKALYQSFLKFNKLDISLIKNIKNMSILCEESRLLEIPFYSYFIIRDEIKNHQFYRLSLEIYNVNNIQYHKDIYKYIIDIIFQNIKININNIVEDFANKTGKYLKFYENYKNSKLYKIIDPKYNNYISYLCSINNIMFSEKIIKINIKNFKISNLDDDISSVTKMFNQDINYLLNKFNW